MPRFVLLRHECPPDYEKPSHWDFMLEWEGVLRTWELRNLPATWAELLGESRVEDRATSLTSHEVVDAIRLPDHRIAYLEYEGQLSNGRGAVSCCDRGTYALQKAAQGQYTLRLTGRLLHGSICLREQGLPRPNSQFGN